MSDAQERSRQLFFKGIEHFEAGRLETALECFEGCLALTPDRASVRGNLGVTLFKLGRTREALPHLQSATAAEPQFVHAWAALGLTHEAHGDWAQACEALRHAVVLDGGAAPLWHSLGQCLARSGRPNDALQAFDRALAADPTLAATWSVRGGLLRELHRFDDAARSFEQAIAHGADPELHAYYLASVRGGSGAPAQAPRHYVQALFDDYAADFQQHLVDKLGYRGHEVLLQPIVDGGRHFRRVIDLGCGTGLCGALLQSVSDAIDGVDLSAGMLVQARATSAYRTLVQADIGEYLAGASAASADLVVAADVLNYVGELSALFDAVARVLEPAGLFVFTVECAAEGGADLQLLPSLRYAHSRAGVCRLAERHGLAVDSMRDAPIRHEQGLPVAGLYVHLRNARA